MNKNTIKPAVEANKDANAAPKMIPAEQVEAQMNKVINQANQRIQQLSNQLAETASLLRDQTLNFLFKCLEYGHHFSPEFVEKCAGTIEQFMTQHVLTTPEDPEVPTEQQEKTDE